MREKNYFNPEINLYVGILCEDTEDNRIEKIIKILRESKVDEGII
jgi:hypothetical protein